MIFNKKLLLVIFFQLDNYLEMFPANCLEEALMIKGSKHRSWNQRVRYLNPRRAFFFCICGTFPFLFLDLQSSCSNFGREGHESNHGFGRLVFVGNVLDWQSLILKLDIFLRTLFIDDCSMMSFSDNLSNSCPMRDCWVIESFRKDFLYSDLKNGATKTLHNLFISGLVEFV